MTSDYTGALVRVQTTGGGSVEGIVTSLTSSLLTLTPSDHRTAKMDLFSYEVADLEILDLKPPLQPSSCSPSPPPPPKPVTIMRRGSPGPPERPREGRRKGSAFSVPVSHIDADFDFESSNKLFQKEEIFGEWRAAEGGGVSHHNPEKIRPTEMVLSRSPARTFTFSGEFQTDEKIPVVGLSLSRRVAVFKQAINTGLSYSHVVSVAGMALAQMTIQLLGGSCRVNPHNHNKPPVAVVLVGSGDGGKVALTTAIHLSQHSVTVCVLVLERPKGCEGMINVLSPHIAQSISCLPSVVDIIIDGIQDRNTLLRWPGWLDGVIDWTEENAAPLLSIDPQHPHKLPRSPALPKWSCALGAPLLSQGAVGRLFLVDIGLFPSAFQDQDIAYTSPFFDKFVIPLHRTSSC